jgi:CMP/dCMP kinase
MIIAIAGFAGSGKTTLGKALAERLGYRLISPSFKDLATKEGISLAEFQKRAEKDRNIDLKFDEYLKQEAAKGNCVVTTWLGPWMVDADLRIWLFAPAEIRAKRAAERDGVSAQEAAREIKNREEGNRKRYLALYKIDIFDTSTFDVSFNSARFSPQEMAGIISGILEAKKKNNR